MSEKECTRCNEKRIISDWVTGEEICSNCGLVQQDFSLNMGPEKRAFTQVERNNRSRTGLGVNYSLYDKGISTIFTGNRDATGKLLKNDVLSTMRRLSIQDNRSKTEETWRRNLSIAMSELDRMSDTLKIPGYIKERSAVLYRKALKQDLIRGRSIDAFLAACIYAICRQTGVPRRLKEIVNESKRDYSEVARSYRLLIRELKIKMPIDDPSKFIPKIASTLCVSMDTEYRAIEILKIARRFNGIAGKDPKGLSAAALYMACLENDEKRVQKLVASAAGTTEVTLRNRVKGLQQILDNEFIQV